MLKRRLLFFLLTLSVVLTGCSYTVQRESVSAGEAAVEPVAEQKASGLELEMPNNRARTKERSAVDTLIDNANTAIKAGDYSNAAAQIERAIRLASDNARAYFALAQVHFYQNQPELGRSFLDKAEVLAGNDKALLKSIAGFRRKH